MSTEIQQAYYGERSGGHRLLHASNPEDPFFRRLEGTTDHLSTPERGLPWTPYVSGYPLDGRYVLTRTFPGAVTTRSGWALTHALVVNGDDAGEIPDLRSLLTLLEPEPDPTKVSPLSFPELALPAFPEPSGRIGEAIHQLIERAPGSRPVVWIGQEGFEDLVARVWAGLWSDARRGFAFRTAFRPEDADRRDAALFATPVLQVGRWAGFPVVRRDAARESLSSAEALLAGQPSALGPLIESLELSGADLRVLRHVEAIEADLHSVSYLDRSGVRLLARRLSAAAPAPGTAQAVKRSVLDHLAAAIGAADAAFVHSLRNLDPTPFGDTFDHVEGAVSTWTEHHLPDMVADVARWLLYADDGALDWWRRSVLEGVRARLRTTSPATLRLLWDLWRTEPGSVAQTASMVRDSEVAGALALEAPKRLGRDVADPVLEAALKRGWPALYAAAAVAAYPVGDTLARILDAFPQEPDPGLEVLARRAPLVDLVGAVAGRTDTQLDAWATRLICGAPELRGALDPSTDRGRTLWLRSTQSGTPVWAGIEARDSWRDAALEAVSTEDEDQVALDLAGHIANTPAADLSGTPWQDRAWGVLSEGARPKFLRATALGWVERFRHDPDAMPLPNEPLRSEILSTPSLLRARPSHAAGDLGAGLTAVVRFGMQEAALERWVTENSSLLRQLGNADARRLGDLVRRERWRSVARAMYDRRHHAPSLYPALQLCGDLLSYFSQLVLTLERPGASSSDDTWYGALHDFLTAEFPRGPEEHNVWERAGGDLSRLSGSTPHERWWSAVDRLRKGSGGWDLSMGRLMDVLGDERPRSTNLKTLRETAPR